MIHANQLIGRRSVKLFTIALMSILLSACLSSFQQKSIVNGRAAFDLDCLGGEFEVERLEDRIYEARGCNRYVRYRVEGDCTLNSNCKAVRIEGYLMPGNEKSSTAKVDESESN